jgi:hypothetical protein
MLRRSIVAACLVSCVASLPARGDETKQQPVSVGFETLITKHIVVKIKINGKGPYRVIFDTGAPINLINTKTAKASGLLGKNASSSPFSLFGPPPTTKIKALEIGALKADYVPVLVMDHPTVELISKVLGPVEGIIGFPFFARYKMTLDYQTKEMTFVPNGFEPSDIMQTLVVALLSGDAPEKKVLAPAGLWGMVVEKNDEEPGIVVKEVMPRSPAAEAGLKPGDRLLTLDDRWTDTVADCYTAAGYVKPGAATPVVIKRQGKEMELTVIPRTGL